MPSSVFQDTIPFLLRHDPNCVPDVSGITRVLFILFEYPSSIEIKSVNNDNWVTFKSQRSASTYIYILILFPFCYLLLPFSKF